MNMQSPMMKLNNKMMMNPMMMQQMEEMNFNMMMNQFNNSGNNKINRTYNPNEIEIYYQRNNYIDSISKNIFSENDDWKTLINKLRNLYSKLKKKYYRPPYPEEIIERESPKETLEYLLKRGVQEKNPDIEYYIRPNHIGIGYGWKSYAEIFSKNIKEIFKFIAKVNFYIPLRGSGVLSGLEFANLEKDSKTKVLNFSENSPKWRKVCEGLNLFGKCSYSKCEAYKKEVIYPVGINEKFDFSKKKKEIKCPICKKNFIPLTLGFWKCEYQIKGEKLNDGEYKRVNINGRETKDDDFEYFDTDENGTTTWNELIVFACYRQNMKYKA